MSDYWIDIRWCVDDVKTVMPELSDEQCIEVLDFVKKNHSAEIGINWDVLTAACDFLFGNP